MPVRTLPLSSFIAAPGLGSIGATTILTRGALFGALGAYFYHSNIRTPAWIGLLLQRPEHHSIHHQLGVHSYNYGDITLWDRLFGTFKDTGSFVGRCGFPEGQEQKLGAMLRFKDMYEPAVGIQS